MTFEISAQAQSISPLSLPLPMKFTSIHHRGMPAWRETQRNLPVGQKIELIGRFIQETRQLEAIKKSCKPSVTLSNNSPARAY